VTEAASISAYFKQAMSMSINRRLSWSSDGSFISATAGRICGEFVVPLIERSSWELMACLAGHSSSINISRINQRLYKAEGEELNCYSVVAIVSQDSTISIWKPQLQKPFALIMDFCMMGVTDLSWGFNGNILLSSSQDGKVTYFHFKPGILGTPLTEFEKREIIAKRYGNQVLQDYI
jgi:WD40 repeat protein